MRFKDVRDELSAFRRMVELNLEPGATEILHGLESDLEQIAQAAQPQTWKTREEIKTPPNEGDHQRNRSGHGRSLYGVLDFTWKIEPLGSRAGRHQPLNRYFALRNSSVRIRLIDNAEGEVARWVFDVGNEGSPGCYFHAKFAETDENRRMLFHDVDVPRLPTLLFMPTDAIEFMLGELWQVEWERLASSSSKDVNEWRRYPQARHRRLLEWQLEVLKNGLTGTPWAQLKIAKPAPECFLEIS